MNASGAWASAAPTFAPAMAEARAYHRLLARHVQEFVGRRVLEIGFGHGGLAAALPEVELFVGLDQDRAAVAAARAEQSERLRFLVGDVENQRQMRRLARFQFDTVLCANVLEHLDHDGAAIANMLDVLATAGHLILIVPAFPSLQNDLDRLAGHLRRYRRADLVEKLPIDARLVTAGYLNPVGALGWWANRFRRHVDLRSAAIASQVRFFDRWLAPLSAWLTPLCFRWFGQSLLVVAVKR